MKISLCASAFVLTMYFSSLAWGDLIYDISLVPTVSTSSLDIGVVVPVNIVLTESGVNDSIPPQARTLAGGDGLFGFDLSINAAGGNATFSNVLFPGYGPAFNNAANVVITPTSLDLNVTSSAFATSPFQGEFNSSVTIATFDVTYNGTDTLITNADGGGGFPISLGAGFATTAVASGRVNFAGLSVTGVPEPGSMLLLSVGAVLVATRRRRKWSPKVGLDNVHTSGRNGIGMGGTGIGGTGT
ncbi:MAG: PEP-CTERM sorting domain-containing protein [Pirellulaceae bacterium]|jgi:hypothetical protein